MKKILIPIGALLISGLSQAQLTNTENYVYSKTYLDYNGTTATKTSETVQYFDGLGRPKQVVNVKASPTGKDVVTHIEYDGFGRQVKDFLPVPQQGTQNGAIYTSPLSNATQPALYGQEKIFSEKILESSPLDRILQQKQVGNDWSNKPVQFAYDANTTADAVKKYNLVTTWENGATKSGFIPTTAYAAAQLYKNTVTDEDGNQTIEFKNGEGQVVLVRKMLSATEKADTYYVYNEFNQLAYVIPPLAAVSGVTDETTLNNLCYQYRYDGRNRLVEKKLPGKGWEYMLYDKQDRLILTQDANLRNGEAFLSTGMGDNLWLFTKYDKFGRVAYTGITQGGSRASLQNSINSGTANPQNESRTTSNQFSVNADILYTNNAFPTNVIKVLSVNYYDTYPPGMPVAIPTQILGQAVLTQDSQNSAISTKSLPTASYIKNIENDSWTQNYTWYDTKGRTIGTYSQNHLGGFTRTETLLDFAGIPQKTDTYHSRNGGELVQVKERFVYNAQNMLLKHYHQVNSNPEELLAENSYNEKGQLINKKVGNNLQSIDYAYNIRGWMTGINPEATSYMGSKLFGYDIRYQNPTDASLSPKRYNGNISEVNWRVSSNQILKRYAYQYDGLNRLTQGIFLNPDFSIPQNDWNNEEVTYDKNGNIENLSRNAKSFYSDNAEKIDDLEYIYSGNRLVKIVDHSFNPTGYEGGSNTIGYDENGNMISMPDKQINQIGYNYLNLPNSLNIENNKKKLFHLYRADGSKLKKILNYLKDDGNTFTTITEYLDGFQYLTTMGTAPNEFNPMEFAYEQEAFIEKILQEEPIAALQFFPTAEGFYDYENNEYIYQYKDHLGNVRVSYKKDSNGYAEITDQNDYYPFGMNILREEKAIFGVNSLYNYKYNGKELQETGMYDYGARFYMPDIGRWGVVDPLAEKMTRHSPYNYAFNNPIRFIDPDGRSGKDWVQNGNQIFFDASVKSQEDASSKYGDTAKHLGEGSTLTTRVNEEAATTYTFHNNGTVSSDLGALDNRFDHTTLGGTTIMASNPVGGYGALNFGNVATGAVVEQSSGIARVGSNYKLYTATQTGRVFYGNQYVKTIGVSKIGTGIGIGGALIGLGLDAYGVVQYTKNPASPEAVTPTKAATNTGMSAWGILGGPYGVAVAAAYSGVEAIYPGGVEGAMNDNAKFQSELDNGVNKAGPNRVYIIPRGPK